MTTLPAPLTPEVDVDRFRRPRIGEVLVSQGVLTEDQLAAVLSQQAATPTGAPRKRLGALVVELGLATDQQVADALARALGLETVDLQHRLVMPDRVRLLPRAVAERYGLLALDFDGETLTVATSDPINVVAIDDARLYAQARNARVLVATPAAIARQLQRAWSGNDNEDVKNLFHGVDREVEPEADADAEQVHAAPIVRLVDVLLSDGVRLGASDVHLEPQPDGLRVRYRVDGALRDVMSVPTSVRGPVVSRVKILSGLDIAERRRPQDGRAKLVVDGGAVEARVSTLPTLHGEKVVVRLLPRAEDVPSLASTGLAPAQLEVVLSALRQPQGLVLITGPTGSGKTSTLYAAVHELMAPERNIVTLEDPVEVQVPGITQVQVHERAGLSFARGLRSVLRQDPDVVLVGEVRDPETAELALQASLTGHLVLSTVHTNDAVGAVMRLVDMGVDRFLVATSLTLVVAQRLLRRPCAHCAAPYVPEERTLELLGLTPAEVAAGARRGTGCEDCGDTGYKGRVGVFEVLPVTAAMRRVLLTAPTPAGIGAAAREHGITTLRASALAAARRGETTYEEVLRVTQVDGDSSHACPTCSRVLADDMVCCPWDGSPVGLRRCGSCDRPLEAGWSTCAWCSTPIPRQRAPLTSTG